MLPTGTTLSIHGTYGVKSVVVAFTLRRSRRATGPIGLERVHTRSDAFRPDAVDPAALIQRRHVRRRAQPESVFFVDGKKKKKRIGAGCSRLILIHGRVNASTRRKYEREKNTRQRRKYARSRAPSTVFGEHLTKTAENDGENTIGNVCIGRCGVRRSDGNGRIKNGTPRRRVGAPVTRAVRRFIILNLKTTIIYRVQTRF